jgi:hypothetical protein
MGKTKKSVKKFSQKKAKGLIQRRPKFKKHATTAGAPAGAGGGSRRRRLAARPHAPGSRSCSPRWAWHTAGAAPAARQAKRLENMDADAFLDGGFEDLASDDQLSEGSEVGEGAASGLGASQSRAASWSRLDYHYRR